MLPFHLHTALPPPPQAYKSVVFQTLIKLQLFVFFNTHGGEELIEASNLVQQECRQPLSL